MSDSIVVIDLFPYQTSSWYQRHFQTQWSRQFCSQIHLFSVILTHGHGTTVDAILNTPTERSTIACGLFLWYFDRFLNIQGVVITNTRPLRADLFFLQDQLDKSYKFRVLGWQPNKGLMREHLADEISHNLQKSSDFLFIRSMNHFKGYCRELKDIQICKCRL